MFVSLNNRAVPCLENLKHLRSIAKPLRGALENFLEQLVGPLVLMIFYAL